MDKIDFRHTFENPQNSTALLNAHNMADSRKARNKKASSIRFSEVLGRSLLDLGELDPLRETLPSEEALQELLDDVRSTGDDLKNRPFPEEILRYKQAVRNFLHYVVENSYELEKLEGLKKKVSSRGETEWRAAVYHQVKVVDQKLDRLAVEILSKQISQLDLKSRVDEITGLLVDLTITGSIRERDE